jgi:double-stranded uracil-DNA glycosylase
VGAYRAGFRRPDARLGRQPERLGSAGLWLLPNPSGLNAHHQLGDLAAAFAELRRASIRRPLLPRARRAG